MTTALAAATTCKLAAAADKQPYRLGSNEMVHTPGIVAWAINGAHFKRDLPQMVRVIESYGVPAKAARALVTKQVPYNRSRATLTISVVFTA
jgi:hypothetical protein